MGKRAVSFILAALLALGAAGQAFAASPEPEQTEEPFATEAPVETEMPAETAVPVEPETPMGTETPAETEAPVETEAPAETEVPAEPEAPAEPETPLAADEPEAVAAVKTVPLWVYDPDHAIKAFDHLNGQYYRGVIIADNQTIPVGAVIEVEVYEGHSLQVTGGTLVYKPDAKPQNAGCRVGEIRVDANAVQLNVRVSGSGADHKRPTITYDDPSGLIRCKNKLTNVPENDLFPVLVLPGGRLEAEGGTAERDEYAPRQDGYALWWVTANANVSTVRVKAVKDGGTTLRIKDPTGKVTARMGSDMNDPGGALADGDAFSGRIPVMFSCPAGYMALGSEFECYPDRQYPDKGGWIDVMYLEDLGGDGTVTVTVAPAVEVKMVLPEGYRGRRDPILAYFLKEGDTTSAFSADHTVPTGSDIMIKVHEDYSLVAENAVVTGSEYLEASQYDAGEHVYYLTVPESGAVTVWVTEGEGNPFTDITPADWYYDSVLQAFQADVVKGMTNTTFGPGGTATRGQTVTMLYRLAGSPASGGQSPFTDLTEGYYKAAVAWAAGQGVVAGKTAAAFAPDDRVTREQLAVMLYRMAGSPAVAGGRLTEYRDGSSVDDYARDGMEWALERGILAGDTDGSLRPTGYATRAEVCTMLMRCKNGGTVWVPKQDVLDWVGTLRAAGETDQLLIVQAQGAAARVSFCEKGANGWTKVFDADGYVGAGGIGKAAEGDSKTPVGNYGFTMAFGALDDPGCAIRYTKLDDSHCWVDDTHSQYYNRFVSTGKVEKDWDSAEHLLAVGTAYNYALALDFNSECVPGEGSAIFLHCSTGGPTAGCIAIPEADMKTVLERVKPDCRIIIDTPAGVKGY